jgi:hypothetical protein
MTTEQNYYKPCEIYVPIVLKVPICVEPEVVAKPVDCKTNGYGYKPYSAEPAQATV